MSNSCETIDKYKDIDKWRDIIELTLNNYSNMKRRLSRNCELSNIILIYYSVFLIVLTLTCKYYPQKLNDTLAEYFSILLSIVLLIFSIINNNARYPQRISSLEVSINGLKTLKRRINDSNIDEIIVQYNDIVDNTEMRQDVDFFMTLKSLCKKNNIRWYGFLTKTEKDTEESIKIKDYLTEINRFYEQINYICKNLTYYLLSIIPILLFIACWANN